MKKVISVILLDLSAILGVVINASYYRTSFIFSGYGKYYAISLAAAFMILEVVLWMKEKSSWYLWILKIAIIVYSISVTLGAQFQSTSNMESETAAVVFETTDISGDVEYYREQIKKQDDRIDSIYRERENKSIYTLSKDALELAESKKSEYEILLLQITGSPITVMQFLQIR